MVTIHLARSLVPVMWFFAGDKNLHYSNFEYVSFLDARLEGKAVASVYNNFERLKMVSSAEMIRINLWTNSLSSSSLFRHVTTCNLALIYLFPKRPSVGKAAELCGLRKMSILIRGR